MVAIIWNHDEIGKLLRDTKSLEEFARMKTPNGLRTKLRAAFKRSLEGKCFLNAMTIACQYPDKFWYCEGYAAGKTPHAWLSPKLVEDTHTNGEWALDVTWPCRSKHWLKPWDKISYRGIRLEGLVARKFLTDRAKSTGLYTSASLLKYPSEIAHLLVK